MKVSKRHVPDDALIFTHKDYRVSLMTHRNKITVSIWKNGDAIVHSEWLTPEKLISLLMGGGKEQ